MRDIAQGFVAGSEDPAMVVCAVEQLKTALAEPGSLSGRLSSVKLVGTVHVVKGSDRRPSLIGWDFPRSTQKHLPSSDGRTRLSVFQLAALQTASAVALYEIAKRDCTSQSERSVRHHWHWWHGALSGKLEGSAKMPDYLAFKRDVLLPAIQEVNRTDIRVALTEFKHEGTVDDLQLSAVDMPG